MRTEVVSALGALIEQAIMLLETCFKVESNRQIEALCNAFMRRFENVCDERPLSASYAACIIQHLAANAQILVDETEQCTSDEQHVISGTAEFCLRLMRLLPVTTALEGVHGMDEDAYRAKRSEAEQALTSILKATERSLLSDSAWAKICYDARALRERFVWFDELFSPYAFPRH
ncbi:MAG: hypothetical protein HY341_03015 [Candidatus Kerfeldbacteria bacterium]|nr:hypothetical protein [Candidatus Kerfeldbacteria bacterium]